MIADLEHLGQCVPEPQTQVSNTTGRRADHPFSEVSRISPPATLLQRVMETIDLQPPRVRTDAKGHVTEINPAFSGLCGFSFEEIRGRSPGSLLQGPDTEPEAIAELRHAVKTGTGCTTELYNYHKDGSRYRVRINVTPIRDEDGSLVGFEAVETRLSR